MSRSTSMSSASSHVHTIVQGLRVFTLSYANHWNRFLEVGCLHEDSQWHLVNRAESQS